MDYLGANCDNIWMNIYDKIYLQNFFPSDVLCRENNKMAPSLVLSAEKMLDDESFFSRTIPMAIGFYF